MSTSAGKLTVFFEEPFWVGVFERIENGKLSVSKVTFGTEPKELEQNLSRRYNYNMNNANSSVKLKVEEKKQQKKRDYLN